MDDRDEEILLNWFKARGNAKDVGEIDREFIKTISEIQDFHADTTDKEFKKYREDHPLNGWDFTEMEENIYKSGRWTDMRVRVIKLESNLEGDDVPVVFLETTEVIGSNENCDGTGLESVARVYPKQVTTTTYVKHGEI